MTHRQDATTTPAPRQINAGAPGYAHVAANVLVHLDPSATLEDTEAAIKDAARAAIRRAREVLR